MTMAIVIGCFMETFSSEKANFQNVWQWAKDSQLRVYLEVYSPSSDQVFLSIQLKTFSKFSGWTFFAFELYYSLFQKLVNESSYQVD